MSRAGKKNQMLPTTKAEQEPQHEDPMKINISSKFGWIKTGGKKQNDP